ncbi:MAG: hypothetical protein ACRD1X_05565, partial [Vicinamibacteria bacterium]
MEDALFSYGPLGIFVVLQMGALIVLYRDNQRLRDKREEDAKTMTTALIGGTASQNRMADALEEFTRRLPEWISGRSRTPSPRGG